MSQWTVKRANADEIDSHWCMLIESLQASPAEFYRRLNQVIIDRKIPGLEGGLVDWREGGPLSAKRLYFRLLRERIVIDICAAPFGTGFFVSWRLGHVWLRLRFLAVFALIIAAAVALSATINPRNWEYILLRYQRELVYGAAIAVLSVFCALVIMRAAVGAGLRDLDALLLHTPIVAGFYERFLRPVTYYRIDQAVMYQQAVHAAVMQVVDEMTEAQKLPRLSESERKPILRDYYKR
jgi:hypothetical protein